LSFVPPPSGFNKRLILWNGLIEAGFSAWDFLPGMRFDERIAWWRGESERDRGGRHEGLDFCCYRTGEGRRLGLGAGALVPVIFGGAVVALVDDFLGKSLFVAHECRDSQGRQLHSIYGHLHPRPELAPGSLLEDGAAVGVVADTSGGKNAVPPHLHLTLALIHREGGPERLDWSALRDSRRVLLLDPMIILK
jgi:hypothetical protein